MKYVALLRGINVGGNNIIRMEELRKCFENAGFRDVATYIQSGNVIFSAPVQAEAFWEKKIERCLKQRFGNLITAVVLSGQHLGEIIREAPVGFGARPDLYRSDVIFLKPPLTPKEAIRSVSMREGVDQASAGRHALYFSRLTAQATKSHLTRLISLPIYKSLTIRNWNTAKKLAALSASPTRAALQNQPGKEEIEKIRLSGYRPEAVGCLLRQRRILFVYKREHDLWQLPQGGVERGESLEEALRREMAEELGAAFAERLAKNAILVGESKMRLPEKHVSRPSVAKGKRVKKMRGKQYFFLAAASGAKAVDIAVSDFDDYTWASYQEALDLLKKTDQKGKARLVRRALGEMQKRGLLA